MDPVVHFEIPVDDLHRAKKFYEACFGWQIKQWSNSAVGEYWSMVTKKDQNAPGINGGMMPRKMPGQSLTIYMTVDSIDAALAKVRKNGGSVCVPKTMIGENMGGFACFIDTEGNMVGVHEMPQVLKTSATKKSAKKPVKKKAIKKKK